MAILLDELPTAAVHAWFLVTVPLYGLALVAALRRGPRDPPGSLAARPAR